MTLTADFLLMQLGLYEVKEFESSSDDAFAIDRFLNLLATCDGYCIACASQSVFEINSGARATTTSRNLYPTIKTGIHQIDAICTRNRSHVQHYWFQVIVEVGDSSGSTVLQEPAACKIQKIGQFPSFASLTLPDVEKYRGAFKSHGVAKVEADRQLQEFQTGVRLAAHGYYIGACAYLRRVFEYLVRRAKDEATKRMTWDEMQETEYEKSEMVDKIEMLEGFLPEFLVNQRAIYGILSKGIHSLSEEQCQSIFANMRSGIELILMERKQQLEHADMVKSFQLERPL